MPSPPDATLLITPHCPHCRSVLVGMSELVKEGKIGRLEVVNIAVHPEVAEHHGIRSAPWIRIGTFELTGNYTPSELTHWAEKASAKSGETDYLRELLEQQQLDEALAKTVASPSMIQSLLELLQNRDLALAVRFGLSAIMEDLAPRGLLTPYIEQIGLLTRSEVPSIRADAAYYLGLTGNQQAEPFIRDLLDDPVNDVKEIAEESLELLNG